MKLGVVNVYKTDGFLSFFKMRKKRLNKRITCPLDEKEVPFLGGMVGVREGGEVGLEVTCVSINTGRDSNTIATAPCPSFPLPRNPPKGTVEVEKGP